ncbi:hypothetical protein [Streptomyces iranensis]|uniref:Secreted protein n=1 Tax=Streptomyces iranensis TaxID=576784 RepID=A0A060ZAZ9_9ACTN|nr:hypothetical protein [Streptomyces iranensis]MBP2068514.1 hypothetical protein [Streptomyces iranensis]CDR01223.1 predicted protein [Streptomyces iranensis]
MARISRIALSLVALLGGTILALPGTASADVTAVTAYNTRSQHLIDDPRLGWEESCVERRIKLDAGSYDWGRVMGSRHTSWRTIELGADWYTWRDCLWPKNGYYLQTTMLDPDNPDWVLVSDSASVEVAYTGTWTWGGYLDPQF